MAKVKVKKNVKTASFELLTDYTPERRCTGCGKLLRTPEDLLPGYVPEWAED